MLLLRVLQLLNKILYEKQSSCIHMHICIVSNESDSNYFDNYYFDYTYSNVNIYGNNVFLNAQEIDLLF